MNVVDSCKSGSNLAASMIGLNVQIAECADRYLLGGKVACFSAFGSGFRSVRLFFK